MILFVTRPCFACAETIHNHLLSTVNYQPITKIQWYISNGKDVSGTTDGSCASETKTYQYTPYGQAVDNSDQQQLRINNEMLRFEDNPFQYSEYYQDFESEMYYLNARYYSPELTRFISRDSYDLANRYAYCDGDPISQTDPSGHMPGWLNCCLAGLAVAGGIVSIALSGGSLLPAGLGIAGDVLGIASGGTQIGAYLTDGSTSRDLNLASLVTGIAGITADGLGIACRDAGKVVPLESNFEMMSAYEIEDHISTYGEELGHGVEGTAYLYEGKVYKVYGFGRRSIGVETPAMRDARVFNECNSHLPGITAGTTGKNRDVLVTPFAKKAGSVTNDQKHALCDLILSRCERIVDDPHLGNFGLVDGTQQAMIVDVGHALCRKRRVSIYSDMKLRALQYFNPKDSRAREYEMSPYPGVII